MSRQEFLLRLGHDPTDPNAPGVPPLGMPAPSPLWSQQQQLLPTPQSLIVVHPEPRNAHLNPPGMQGVIPPDAQLKAPQFSAGTVPLESRSPTIRAQTPMDKLRAIQTRIEGPGAYAASSPGVRSQTIGDQLRHVRDQISQLIAPYVGLDWNELANDEERGILRGIMLLHGSKATNLEKEGFDLAKIGTGEGSQAFGWGVPYAAERRGVATSYRPESYWPGGVIPKAGSAERQAAETVRSEMKYYGAANEDAAYSAALKRIQEVNNEFTDKARGNEMMDIIRNWQKSGAKMERAGALYQIDVPDEQVAKMLDWDAPLTQQPKNVQDYISYVRDPELWQEEDPEMTGGQFYRRAVEVEKDRMEEELGSASDQEAAKNVSMDMLKAGIPGNKYFDALSRNKLPYRLAIPSPRPGSIDEAAQRYVLTKGLPAKFGDDLAGVMPDYGNVLKYIEMVDTNKNNASRSAVLARVKQWQADGVKILKNEERTRNYVLFDPKIIKSVKRVE